MSRSQKQFSSESALAVHVVRWLEAQRWDVYQEVEISRNGHRADIVAVHGSVLWVVETKLSLSLDLIDQVNWWHGFAHFASVAIPRSEHRSHFGSWICAHLGIGVLSVSKNGAIEQTSGRMDRKAFADYLRKVLTPEHKTFAAAGNADSLRWTPYQRTCRALAQLVAAKPGICLKDAIADTEHHYVSDNTARACIRHWLDCGKVRGVRLEREGRYLRLYPEATP